MQKGQDQQDFKKKRQEFTVNVRKEKREETISRRRNMSAKGVGEQRQGRGNGSPTKVVDLQFKEKIEEFQKDHYEVSQLLELLTRMQNGDIEEKHRAIIGIRKILHIAQQDDAAVQLCKVGGIPLILEFARQSDYLQLRFQAFWALANVASSNSEVCGHIMELGALDLFISELDSGDSSVVENVVWGLGNLAADQTSSRDRIIAAGGLVKIIKHLEGKTNAKVYQDVSWAIANICRGTPPPNYEQIKIAVPALAHGIKHGYINSEQILSDVLWTLAHVTEGAKVRLTRLLETGAMPSIFECLDSTYAGIYIPAMRIIGNFSSGHTSHTNVLLENNFAEVGLKLLNHGKQIVRKEASWALSNIAAGTDLQILYLLSKPHLIHKLVQLLDTDTFGVRIEILWLFANLERNGVSKDILLLYQVVSVVEKTLQLLGQGSEYILINTLECLYRFLRLGQKIQQETAGRVQACLVNPMAQECLQKGLVVRLAELQKHQSNKVYQNVSKILQTFFTEDMEEQT